MSLPDVEVITYGGGDLLRMVFNAISMLFYGNEHNNNFVRPLCITTATIGFSWSISRCFFQSYTDAFLTKYFLPLLALPTLLIVPQARIHIIDKLDNKPIVVEHVPLLFAKVAGLSSYWGYEITQAIENVMHTPNDARYSKTGMIFGADTALDFSRLKLNNATLAQNLRHFSQQCIIYDVALGRYTIDQLRKSSDLLNFLKENTSRVRMIPYIDPKTKTTEFLSCIESMDKMGFLFDQEVAYYTKHEILKNLPASYQTLVGFQAKSENRIAEQLAKATHGDENSVTKNIIAVNAFDDAMARFATERARDNQRSIYQTAGSLAGTSLVTLRIILEALIYASFALIVPLSLLPGGLRFISSWVFLNVWIQLWPPLYGILNYITMICAQKYASSVMGGISNGFSLFTSAGFQDLAFDTAAIGGYLSLSVPILSFYLLQNLQSLVHLAPSMLSPTHAATNTAAAELSSGNYSYANTSLGQNSYDNQTAFQQNVAPTLSSGFFTDNHGTHQVKYGRDQLTANQDVSNLNTSISTADAYSDSLQNSMQNAQTRVDSTNKLFTETMGVAERSGADFIQHLAGSESYSNGYSTSETNAAQESANWITNAAQSWGNQHGLSGRESLEYFAGMGLDASFIFSGRTGHNQNCSVLSDDARQSAENIAKSNDFQEHYQRVLNSSHNESTNNMTDEGRRFAENYAVSTERLKSAQEQYSVSNSELNQIADNLSYVQSHTSTVNTNLNTEFSNWLNDRGALGSLFDRDRVQELDSLRDAFISEKCQSTMGALDRFKDPTSSSSILPSMENEWNELKGKVHQKANDNNLSYGLAQDSGQSVIGTYESQNATVSHKFVAQQQEVNNSHQNLKSGFSDEAQKLGMDRLHVRMKNNGTHAFNHACSDEVNWSWFDSYSNPQGEN